MILAKRPFSKLSRIDRHVISIETTRGEGNLMRVRQTEILGIELMKFLMSTRKECYK